MGIERWTITAADEFRPDPNLIERIFARDGSVWGPGEDDPATRLGWLDLPHEMAPEVPGLSQFASEAAAGGFRDVVVLGMGGSSLAPEVWARTFGLAPGYPELTVLDTTHPAAVRAATETLDLDRTLWIVSSKSGGTVETMSLYRHFRSLHDNGASFVAITDAGTSLATLAAKEGFRSTFINPSDIGGRYSALSLFGLVPAAVIGVDLNELLARARDMAAACMPETPAASNSALQIGTAIASLAKTGRDKLTWLISPAIESFGPWVEQLIAESTGKRGVGITPVVGEPVAEPGGYGPDRAFVHLFVAGDPTHSDAVQRLKETGNPVIEIQLHGSLDLGAEMWRWELAVAVAGAVLGINAFDQPDVEAAKKAARSSLDSDAAIDWPEDDPDDLFAGTGPPELVCLLAFVNSDENARAALRAARAKLLTRYGVASSVGFGPRYLHSTGQLHKGGPSHVRALVVLEAGGNDVPIPGSNFGFGRLIAAQAEGDARALAAAGRRVARTSLARFEKWASS